jgi:hypothetical protein
MVKVDTIEGIVDDVLWCHYDITDDVLYLRLTEHRQAPAYSEETDDGLLMVRRQDNDQVVGMTVVNWWRRFGSGPLPDSIQELERAIEPWAQKLAA